MPSTTPRQLLEIDTDIAGIHIRWITDCKPEEEELRRTLRYHVCPQMDSSEIHRAVFSETDSLPPVSSGAVVQWEGPYVVLGNSVATIRWYRDQSGGLDYILLTEEICIVHDRRHRLTTCHLKARRENDMSVRPRIWDALVVILHTILSMYGRYSVHSAAVGFDGYARLFLGESGSGKSTLSTDLAAQGADFLGDDLTFLYLDEKGEVNVGSLLLDAKLITTRWASEKKHIDVGAATGCPTPLSLPLSDIFLIRRAKGKSYITSAEPSDCLGALINASNNVRMQWDPTLWYATFEQAASAHRYFIFHFGNRRKLDKDIFRNV